MPTPRSHLISITLTPAAAQLVEAKRAGEGVQVLRRSSLSFGPGVSLDQPAALGQALADHLKATGYTTRHAVVGLCPRWVLARHKQVPRADPDALRGIVNIQIEREFAGSASDMTFDYLLAGADDAPRAPLLLAGVRSVVLKQVKQAAEAAGLKSVTLTPTSFAGAAGQSGTVVMVEEGIAGVMRVNRGAVVGLASCPVDTAALDNADARARLITDAARCLLQMPSVEGAGVTLTLPPSVSESAAKQLTAEAAERFGPVETHPGDPAEMLARHALRPGVTLIDFNDSRLAPPRAKRLTPAMQWGIRAAVLAVLIGGTLAYLWFDAVSHRDNLQAEYDAIQGKAAELEQVRLDIRRAETWYDKRPPMLDALKELTQTFPSQGNIRVTSLSIDRQMKGLIDCKAGDKPTMDRYFSQMQQSPRLSRVDRAGPIRPSGGNDPTLEFSIAFEFDPRGKPEGADQ